MTFLSSSIFQTQFHLFHKNLNCFLQFALFKLLLLFFLSNLNLGKILNKSNLIVFRNIQIINIKKEKIKIKRLHRSKYKGEKNNHSKNQNIVACLTNTKRKKYT